MNAKQFRQARRHFMRTQGHKLMELRLLGASQQTLDHFIWEGNMKALQRTIDAYRRPHK